MTENTGCKVITLKFYPNAQNYLKYKQKMPSIDDENLTSAAMATEKPYHMRNGKMATCPLRSRL